MRKKLRLIIFLIFIGVFSLLIYGISVRIAKVNNMGKSIQSLPDFTFFTLDGKPFKSSDIKAGPVLIAYYHPECEHCQYEINGLFNKLEKINETKILLISFAERDSINAFFRDRMSQMNENIILLIDDSLSFKTYFSTSVVPSTFIYDKELKLKKMYKGEVKPDAIIDLLDGND